MHQEILDLQLAELEGRVKVVCVLHLSAAPYKDDYKGMQRHETGERAGIVPFIPL